VAEEPAVDERRAVPSPAPPGAVPPEPTPVDLDPTWVLVRSGDDPLLERVDETLLTVADGLVGTRGILEEDGTASDPPVALAGRYVDGDGQGVDATPTLLPGPRWTQLLIGVPMSRARMLDLRSGVLLRVGGRDLPIHTLRFQCLARPGLAVLRAEGPAELLAAGPDIQLPDPTQDGGYICREGTSAEGSWATIRSSRAWVSAVARTEVVDTDGRRVLDRQVRFDHGRGAGPNAAARREALDGLGRAPFPVLLAEQQEAWRRRWARADVVVEGDPDLQLAIRVALYHLMCSATDQREAVVGARGLTGRAYRGHVFWDADVFVLPFLAATHPPAARAMLAYRLGRLPAARAAAAELGRAGARFPWESADDGVDVTPRSTAWLDGQVLPILTGELQEHITADVAWAANHYLAWTGDRGFARGDARTLLIDTARYWRSRVSYDADGAAHLLGVMGPDEYHAPVDDNAFTNGMVRWNLRRAAELAGPNAAPDLQREMAAWRRVAADLVDGYRPEAGRHEQFAGYDRLERVEVATLAAPPLAADVLLGTDGVAATQIIKQADVLMLHHLLPHGQPPGSLARDLEHYLPVTSHGSSLSPGVHACLLARLGRVEEAYELLRLTACLDLDDVGGSTAGGLHLAAAGTVWQALVYGFLGLWPERDGSLALAPRLPRAWQRLVVHVTFRGQPLEIRAGSDRLEIHLTRPLALRLGHRLHLAAPPVAVFRHDTEGWQPEGR
jgi:trehalose/maltose hydrolase-like predicted phosphorylase